MKDNVFKLTKERSRRYSTQTITDADHADDIALLANTPAQAESLLHSLERAASGTSLHVNADKTECMSFNQRGDISTLNGSSLKLADHADDIALLANTPAQAESLLHSLERAASGTSLHVNADKTECMSFNQRGDISTLNGSSLKLVDNFTYLGSSVSSTETDINTWLAKAWTATDRLSVIWKSNLINKIKRSFFQAAVVWILLYRCTTWTLTRRIEKRLGGNYTRMLASNIEQVLEAALDKAAAVRPPITHHENYQS